MGSHQNREFDRIIMEQRRRQAKETEKENRIRGLLEAGLDITTLSAVINGKETAFYRMNAVEDHISMIVPEGMKEIPKELLKKAYTEDYVPQYVYAMQDAGIQINYDVLFSEADEESFAIITKEMLSQFRKSYEDFTLALKSVPDRKDLLCYFVKKQKTEAGMIYVLTYFFLVEEYLVMGSIQCTGYRLRDWKEALFQMMCSVEAAEGSETVHF